MWPGIVDRATMTDTEFDKGCDLDEFARAGDWEAVFALLDARHPLVHVNQTRPTSVSQSTVLHIAAEGRAPVYVVQALLDRGAFRSLRNANDQTAYQVARSSRSSAVALLLEPLPSPLTGEQQRILDGNVAGVIDNWIQPLFSTRSLGGILRYPPVGVLHESEGQELWADVPWMSGGFRLVLRPNYLELIIGHRRYLPCGDVRVTTNTFAISEEGAFRVAESCTRERL